MLTNDQCIKVAKVWGWDVRSPSLGMQDHLDGVEPPAAGTIYRIYFDDKNRRCTKWFPPEELQEEINSWQGFGRTVESISFHKCTNPHEVQKKFIISVKDNMCRYLLWQIEKEELWQATHLAALEAVREEEDEGS